MMTAMTFKIHTLLLLGLLTIWGICATFKLYVYTVRDQTALLKKARTLAWREAVLPARRGQILDSDGNILAQDLFRCDLVLDALPENPARRKKLLCLLQEKFPGQLPAPEQWTFPFRLKSELTAEEIQEYRHFFRRYPEVRTAGSFERQILPADPVIREIIGKTALNDQQETVGISGLEQEHDLILSGKPGRIRVMLDRNGIWIHETLRVLRQPENGKNLKLEQSLTQLRGNHTSGAEQQDEP